MNNDISLNESKKDNNDFQRKFFKIICFVECPILKIIYFEDTFSSTEVEKVIIGVETQNESRNLESLNDSFKEMTTEEKLDEPNYKEFENNLEDESDDCVTKKTSSQNTFKTNRKRLESSSESEIFTQSVKQNKKKKKKL